MTYKLLYSQKVRKQILKLEKLQQERILKALERIRIRPRSFVTKLVSTGFFRFKVGDFRVIMDIDRIVISIYVIEIGRRNVIYRPKK